MKTRRYLLIVMVLVLFVVGTIGSVFAARQVARADSKTSRQAFVASSADIASTLSLALQHEQDLAFSAGAFFSSDPDATQSAFVKWTKSVGAFARYPELLTISELRMVTASQLGAFAAIQNAEHPGEPAFAVAPAGNRPYYCLSQVSQQRNAVVVPDNIDYCQTVLKAELLESRNSGKDEYLPYKSGKTEELAVGTAIYSGGVSPGTVQARQAAFIGWTGTAILPGVLLATALKGHPSTAVAFQYGAGSSKVTFTAGRSSVGAESTTVGLHNGWSVHVLGPVTSSGLLTNRSALSILLSSTAFFFLLGLLLYVLGTSRSRALELVEERTVELRYQAFHDSLTGLPNRVLILDRIGQMMAQARRSGATVAVLYLDIDNFKDINDTLGHRAGDDLLAGVGTRLAGMLREGDTVGRLGGDEFVLLSESSSPGDLGQTVARRILAALEAPFEIPGNNVPLTVNASIGIATGDRATPEELLRDADIALYRAKAAGKHQAVSFAPSMLESVDDLRNLDVDLHNALQAGQFFVLYQPTFDLKNGSFTGVEALLRWRHPTRGVVQPENFIPGLESSGLIVPVGQWVLEAACRQGAIWQRNGHRFVVSVNIAAKQLQRDRIVDDVYGALTASGFDPAMLVLELTESTLMQDVPTTVIRLNLLKALGVRLAIDDFGTGFSSLAYLQQFPIDILKIDRSFVAAIGSASKSAAIIRTFVQLGKALSLEVVAEGIENDEQRFHLTAADVDTGQGFLFARPLEVEAVDAMLAEPHALDSRWPVLS